MTGAVLPGAIVTVTGPSLQNRPLSTMTLGEGMYRASLVPPGTYDVRVDLAGFDSQTRHGVDVAIDRETTLDFTMKVSGLAESIEVSGRLATVQVGRSDLTSLVTERTIDALPLNGRNFTDLVALVPGARADPSLPTGANVEIFGERAGAASYLVDGAENNDPVNGGALLRFTQDSIREFEVITTGYSAEFGRAQGGVANIVTRSGTNQMDGRAFWFVRNDRMDSSNIAAASPPALERYQWGGTVGGPVVTDRAFFFGSFERLNEGRGVNIDRSKIPAFVLSGLATPGHTEDFGVTPQNDGFTGLFKTDLNVSSQHRLTGSINRSTLDSTGIISSPVAGTIALPSAAATQRQPATSASFRETAVFGRTRFLETMGTFVRGEQGENLDRVGRSEPILLLLRSGFLQTGAPFGGQADRLSKRFQVAQSLSDFRSGPAGDHQLKVGWDFNHVTLTGFNQVANDVEYSPGFLAADQAAIFARTFDLYGFQQSAARFLTLSASPDGNLNVNLRTNDLSAFAEDTWRPRPDVTLSLGLRYEYASLFGDYKKGLAPRIGIAWDLGGTHQTVVKANYGLLFDRNLLAAAATVPEKGGVFTKSVFDVALPRLGVDYTDSLIDYVITSGFPKGAGGFGPSENPLYRQFAADLRADPLALYETLGISVTDPVHAPVVTAANIQSLSGKTPDQALAMLRAKYPGTDWRFFDVPGGSILGEGSAVLSFFPRGSLDATRIVSRYARDLVPYTNAFNAGIERQLAPDLSASAMFVHRRTRDLLTRRIVNLFDAAAGTSNFGKTVDGGPQISMVTYDGFVEYDGFIVSLRKQFSGRYQFEASYTGSRARDNLLTGTVGTTFSNNNHPELDEGPSNQSAPHVFVASGVAALPSEVTVSGIAFWRSGSAFNPRGIIDTDGDGLVDQRDLSLPRNEFRVKPYADVDVRIEKKVRLGRHSASVLVEAFNVFNRDNVTNVNAVSGPQFGTAVAYGPGREVQIGVRYFFGR